MKRRLIPALLMLSLLITAALIEIRASSDAKSVRLPLSDSTSTPSKSTHLTTFYRVTDLKRLMPADVLLVVAHPDDDTIFAGTLALLRHSGIAVQVVYLTSGEDGIDRTGQYQPGEALARARRVELLRALSVLGVDRPPVVLEFPDGKVKDVPIQSIEQQILAILQVTHPSTVFAFGEDGYTGHPDHQAAGEATENALKEWNKGHPDKRIQLYQRAILPSTFQAIKKEAIEFGNQTVLPDHIHPGAIKHDAVVQPISTALQQKIDAVSAYPTQFSPEMVQDFARFFKRVPTEDYYVLTP